MTSTTLKENEKAIADFLLDIECLKPLSKYSSEINVFDVLKITRTEIRHSNVLAWLLDPCENHGLGDQFIKGFVQTLVESSEELQKSVFRLLMVDFGNFSVQREYHNIDLLLVSDADKILICVENKVDSGEHDNQLEKYRNFIENKYKGEEWIRLYVFLSPDGHESSDPENWNILSYEQIVDLLLNCMENNVLDNDCRLILEHYIKAIRRNIMTDRELIEICNSIYLKHKKALDLIFENRQDYSSGIYSILVEWCKQKAAENKILFDTENSSKSYVRFSTESLESLYPLHKTAKSGWNNNHPAFYEIKNNGKTIRVVCSVSSINLPPELIELTQHIAKKELKESWQWTTIYSDRNSLKINEEEEDSIDKERIFEFLDEELLLLTKFEDKMKVIKHELE